MAVEVTKRRFTADDYVRMHEAGIFGGDRVELIDGNVITMISPGPRHCAAVDRATRAMFLSVGDRAIVRVQGAVRLNLFNMPQPDLALLRPRQDFYASGHPAGADILLIVEVADSSINYDRTVKALTYARLGVHEYWIAGLNERLVHRYSSASREAYRQLDSHGRGRTLSPQLLPDCTIAVDDLLAD